VNNGCIDRAGQPENRNGTEMNRITRIDFIVTSSEKVRRNSGVSTEEIC
jgi:hypothetical protein